MDVDEADTGAPAWETGGEDDALEEITNLEERFYQQGYKDGHAHGALHGLFEGRQLGQEKAFEIWEEVGYYEGWAGMWVKLLISDSGAGGKKARALNHAKTLLDLIAKFPTTNPTPVPDTPISPERSSVALPPVASEAGGTSSAAPAAPAAPETDLTALMSNIRARYKLLCTQLGVRPRLVASSRNGDASLDDENASTGVVEGIEGPMKGVDTRNLKF